MANRILTADEVYERIWSTALDQVGGDKRAAKTLLCLMSPMVQRPPKSERDYLKFVLDKLEKEKV